MKPSSLFIDPRYLMSEVDPAKVRPCAAEAAFVGRSNVGKSSLVNAILRRPLAKVSQTPGRTRTINVFQAGFDRWLVDLPGYGFARGPAAELFAWRRMVESYLTGRPSLRRVVLVVDAEVGPTELDLQMADWLDGESLPRCVVATKTDKVKPSRGLARRKEIASALGMTSEALAWVSAAESEGIDGLREALRKDLSGGETPK